MRAGCHGAGEYLLHDRVLALAGSSNLTLVALMIAPIAIILGAIVLGETLAPNADTDFSLLTFGLIIIDGRLIDRMRQPR